MTTVVYVTAKSGVGLPASCERLTVAFYWYLKLRNDSATVGAVVQLWPLPQRPLGDARIA